ncbi:MAG: GNAT family N-acetyltransferase [Solirubrobacteraceae bacterium]
MARRWLPGGFELDDDRERIDVDAVHAFIASESYWGRGRPRELVERAIAGSARVVGLYLEGRQTGFGRAITDGAILAYLSDVYVLEPHRGRGLGLELIREIVDNGPYHELTWLLHSADAQGVYEKLGFKPPSIYPLMERTRKKVAGEAPYMPGA